MSALAKRFIYCSSIIKNLNGLRSLQFLSYKSALCLENVYPNSRQTIFTPSKPPDSTINDKFNGFIPIDQLEITYSRSSGPGGQNVNTVSTKVDLRLHLESANWLHADVKSKMLEEHKTKISKDGFLIIRSDKTRSQQINLADAMSKLRTMLWKAAAPEPQITPETEERLRKRREKQSRERLMQKRIRSSVKEGRQAPTVDL